MSTINESSEPIKYSKPPKKKRLKKKFKPLAFVPTKILLKPPIQHRNTGEAKHYLLVDQFAVAIGAVMAARVVYDNNLHKEAFELGGGKGIEREKAADDRHRASMAEMNRRRKRGEDAPFPERHHTFPTESLYDKASLDSLITGELKQFDHYHTVPLGRLLKAAGSHGYKQLKKKLRKQPPPDIICVEISKRALLRRSGLQDDGGNYHRLKSTLNRLKRRVGPKGPVLKDWALLPNGPLRLRVSGRWLRPPFGRIAWPPPLRSATACALFMFLNAIDTGVLNQKGIRLKSLYGVLGIEARWSNADALRTLNRALATVNKHLNTINRDAIDKLSDRLKIKVPAQYVIEPMADDEKIRFKAMPFQSREELAAEDFGEEHKVRDLTSFRPRKFGSSLG